MKNLKQIIFAFLISSIVFSSFSQNAELKNIADDMFEKTNDRDFDALLDMTYPAVYDLVPKETMKTLFKSMFEGNDEMKINLPKLQPEYELTEVYKSEDGKIDYAFMNYDMKMSMTFKKQEFDDEGKEMMIKAMKAQGMDASFETDSKVNVDAPNRLVIFLKDEKTNDQWKMINYDPSSPLFVQILPVEIIEKAKSRNEAILLASKKN